MLLNISAARPDCVLWETQRKIARLSRVTGAFGQDGVEGLEMHLGAVRGATSLDLIAHAPGGVLELGGWSVGAVDAETQRILPTILALIAQEGVDQIRILGCCTAVSAAGQAAILGLQTALRTVRPQVKLYGTTLPMDANNFTEGGLDPNYHALSNTASFPITLEQETLQTLDAWKAYRDRWFAALCPAALGVDEALSQLAITSVADILGEYASDLRPKVARLPAEELIGDVGALLAASFAPGVAEAPGLLAGAEKEFAIPVPGQPGTYHRASLLLFGTCLRVYPTSAKYGVILPLKDRGLSTFDRLAQQHGEII